MIPLRRLVPAVLLGALAHAGALLAQGASVRLDVTNELDAARPGEIVDVPATLLAPRLAARDLATCRVVEAATSREVLAQAVDDDGDDTPDRLVLQSDFAPRETKTYVVSAGGRRAAVRADFRVYARFVRERFDDFAWENDRVAFRTYGPALETWQKEPLTSSGIDVWVKRTPALVINDWYLVDDYHRDHGEGGDFYSVGPSRGCGGSGVVRDGRLFVSRNFRSSRVLANGPVRLVFELTYDAWDAVGAKVTETKRVTLDAGSQLNRFDSLYVVSGAAAEGLAWAAGIKKASGASIRSGKDQGILRSWEAFKEPNGALGCGLIADPASVAAVEEKDGNVLVISKPGSRTATYWAGFGWDRNPAFKDAAAWDRYLDEAAARLRSPLRVSVQKEATP